MIVAESSTFRGWLMYHLKKVLSYACTCVENTNDLLYCFWNRYHSISKGFQPASKAIKKRPIISTDQVEGKKPIFGTWTKWSVSSVCSGIFMVRYSHVQSMRMSCGNFRNLTWYFTFQMLLFWHFLKILTIHFYASILFEDYDVFPFNYLFLVLINYRTILPHCILHAIGWLSP